MTSFEHSAGAFVFRKDGQRTMFLLLKRKSRARKDASEYDLPKGHIEKGESAIEAARREILEETGIKPQFIPFFSESTHYFFFSGGQRISKGVKFFLAQTGSASVTISDEHSGYEWAECDDAIRKLKFKDLASIISKAKSYIGRMDAMKALNAQYAAMPARVPGWGLSTRLVPGEGRLDAEVMLLGQAPGANEDQRLRPFVGRSGMLLDSVLRKVRINRSGTYITSVVQFFPPQNRLPDEREVDLCRPFLDRQIGIIRPSYMVLMGNLASSAMLGRGEVEKNHGSIVEKDGTKYMVTFHPAAALRFRDKHRLMIEDFRKFSAQIKKPREGR